jgi:4-hydroxybenzoate polyprenyltransferase
VRGWDERRARGRATAWLFLVHPGPSLLVTVTFVAVASAAAGSAPSPLRVVQLAGLMLPIQFAIGAVNDLADRRADAAAKPWKPLVRGAVPVGGAAGLALGCALGGLVSAATLGWPVLGLAAAGLGAGLAYDLGLRRAPWSLAPWWLAFLVLPLAAFVAAGRSGGRWVWVLVPLAGLLAIGLHLANALPDIAGDRAAGARNLAVTMGERWSRRLALGALAAAAVLAVDLAGWLGQPAAPVLAGAALLLAVVVGVALTGVRRPFPVLAPAGAVLAVVWLVALPR